MNWPTFSDPSPNERYAFTSKSGDNRPVRVLIGFGLLFMAGFAWVYGQPENRGHPVLFGMLTVSVMFKLLRLLHEWYHYWRVKPTTPPAQACARTVDVLTTYCAGEPPDMVVNTLHAIQRIRYPHTTYLCDEADDPYLRGVCNDLGIVHVTRRDKTDAKAGNINNALRQATGDICLIIDPDHVPVPDFLDHVLPHFEDPSVGFVQCVQGYYNAKESIVAFGAAEQTYSFYGPMMTCMGQYGTAQAIGANCTFRRAALDAIGGHANGLSEDMHTAMRLHAGGWESAYVPIPLSYGLVPATFSAYYKQQLKWARGTLELLVTTLPTVFSQLSGRQRLHYATLPLFYLLGVVQLIDLLIPVLSLLFMELPLQLDLLLFGTVYIPLLLTGFLIRQYAQRWLIERHEAGFHLVGGVLASGTWWIYTLGLLYTILRVRVPYIPTPKDDRPRNNVLLVLPNLLMSVLTLGAIAYSLYQHGRFALNNVYFQLMIGFGLLNVLVLSLNVLAGQELRLLPVIRWLNRLSARRRGVRALRVAAWNLRHGLYRQLRRAAIPLFGGVVLLSIGMTLFTWRKTTAENPRTLRYANTQPFYVGLIPDPTNRPVRSLSSLPAVIPHHLGWPTTPGAVIDSPDWSRLTSQIPLLYLEPTPTERNHEADIRAFLTGILRGEHDEALHQFARQIRDYGQPILVSFMPEFDNPARPWGLSQETDLVLYGRAWRHVVRVCREQRADAIWVWCPLLPSSIVAHYPGTDAVDWLGFAVVDNPALVPDRKNHSFAALFQLRHTTVRTHPVYDIRQKPVLITRLEPATSGQSARRWTSEALDLMRERYPEIRGVVFADPADWQTHRADLLTARAE